tara:strand:- start:4212 stop:4928 length:717 start_codon:yes stop_codon:yes gene_type:complete
LSQFHFRGIFYIFIDNHFINSRLKITLYIFSFFFYITSSYGQNRYFELDTAYQVVVIGEDTLSGSYNDYDFKTFEFKQFEKIIYCNEYSKLSKTIGAKRIGKTESEINQEIIFDLKFSGAFINGKRSGDWIYFAGDVDPNTDCYSKYSNKLVKYYNDSVFVSEYDYFGYKEFNYNHDSSSFKGFYEYSKEFKVDFLCDESKQCIFYSDSVVIAKSSISDWKKTMNKIWFDSFSKIMKD